jgi:hypothetical protein
MVTRTRLNVTLYVYCLYCFVASWTTLTTLSIYCTYKPVSSVITFRYSIHFTSEDTKPAELWRDFVRVSDFLLGYDATYIYWLLPTFRRNLPPLSATFKNKGRMRDFTLPRQVYENCGLLGYYAASSGNFLPTFRDNLSVHLHGSGILYPWRYDPICWPEKSVRNYHYSPRNNPEECSTQG